MLLVLTATQCVITSWIGPEMQKMVFTESFLRPAIGWHPEIRFLFAQIAGSRLGKNRRHSGKSSTSGTALKSMPQNVRSSESWTSTELDLMLAVREI